jgi:hypothetical protein
MIFAAIAGSATPVAAAVLPQRAVRPAVAALWSGAALGAFGRLWDLRRGTSLGTVAYLALGWSGLALLPSVVRRHGVGVGALLTGGGVAYSVGAGLFAAKRPNPFPKVFGYHEVWHTATLLGAALHLAAIAEITREGHHARDELTARTHHLTDGSTSAGRAGATPELVSATVVDDDAADLKNPTAGPPEAPRVPVIS